MNPIRISIVGHLLWESGCAHAILGYVRAAKSLGHDVRVSTLSLLDDVIPKHLPIAGPEWTPDLLVIVFESYQFLSRAALKQLKTLAPRDRRIVMDNDGKYSATTCCLDDTNHPSENSRQQWRETYDELSDRILQPTLGVPANGARSFLFFGFDKHGPDAVSQPRPKAYDIAYIGSNWYRWRDLEWFIRSLEPIRAGLGRIALFGKWWDGKPFAGLENYTFSDPSFLIKHRVEVNRSVPFGHVEETMANARINPIFLRPALRALQFVTPRMFETFKADTVPLLRPELAYTASLYSNEILPSFLLDDPAHRVHFVLSHYDDMINRARKVSARLREAHSYEARIAELLRVV